MEGNMDYSHKKVLLISLGAWRNDRNSGSTYTSIFKSWPKDKIAHLYTRPDMPSNNICEKYFQITDTQIIKSIIVRQFKAGAVIKNNISLIEKKGENSIKISWLYNYLRHTQSTFAEILREIAWKIGEIDYKALDEWIKEFNPEYIHLSGTSSLYLYRIAKYISKKFNLPFVIFISDDIYAIKRFRLSPLFWMHRIILRKVINETVKHANDIFVISPLQKEEYEKLFKREMNILTKSISNENLEIDYKIGETINFVYMGNLSAGRWKVLAKIAKQIYKINQQGKKCSLTIYSNMEIPSRIKKKIEIENASQIKPAVKADQVMDILKKNDILVHVESFELANRSLTRLSFSAKLVEYFEAGRCILGVGHKNNASIQYLQKNNAAIVLNDLNKDTLFNSLNSLIGNPNKIKHYAENALKCGLLNHKMGNTSNVYLKQIGMLDDRNN
jgi:hypothetical protein